MSIFNHKYRKVPDYYPTMHWDGFTPDEIYYAKKKTNDERLGRKRTPKEFGKRNHVIKAQQIVEFLMYDCQIYAERRSIYQDIEAINKIALMMSEGCSVDEAEEMLADDIDDEWKVRLRM